MQLLIYCRARRSLHAPANALGARLLLREHENSARVLPPRILRRPDLAAARSGVRHPRECFLRESPAKAQRWRFRSWTTLAGVLLSKADPRVAALAAGGGLNPHFPRELRAARTAGSRERFGSRDLAHPTAGMALLLLSICVMVSSQTVAAGLPGNTELLKPRPEVHMLPPTEICGTLERSPFLRQTCAAPEPLRFLCRGQEVGRPVLRSRH